MTTRFAPMYLLRGYILTTGYTLVHHPEGIAMPTRMVGHNLRDHSNNDVVGLHLATLEMSEIPIFSGHCHLLLGHWTILLQMSTLSWLTLCAGSIYNQSNQDWGGYVIIYKYITLFHLQSTWTILERLFTLEINHPWALHVEYNSYFLIWQEGTLVLWNWLNICKYNCLTNSKLIGVFKNTTKCS